MLGNENRMPFHRRLFPVIPGTCRCQSGCYEINGVRTDGIDALGMDVLQILVR